MIVGLAVSSLVALILTMTLMTRLCGGLFPMELLLGWGFSVANGWAAVILHRRAMRYEFHGCLRWGLAGDTGRLVATGAVLLGRRWIGAPELFPLAIAVVVGYLVFMINDVWLLVTACSQKTEDYD